VRDGIVRDYAGLLTRINKRQYIWGYVTLITSLLRDCVTYGYLIYMVTNGRLTPGDTLLYFGAVASFSGFINGIAQNYNNLAFSNLQMNEMRDFLDFTNRPDPASPADLPDTGAPLSIEFKDVCFSYDGESNVLDNFNLHIEPGEKLALVGVNGAGKTTIIKLLCGFYTPDAGQIFINGSDIARFRKDDLITLFSAVFQDISLFVFSAAENISMRPERDTDLNRARACLEKAGVWDEIEKHPQGLSAKMKKDLDADGLSLSGGQQQKILLARALYKDAPVLILDEPTSALDPIAESEVYEQFHALSAHKTAIYISHRLASTRFCDRIAFLKDGAVAELGHHDALMSLNGSYAEMFTIQSHYYQEGGAVYA
jgi:ABC-type multidrug transport system fused ATPase/permease subunit